MISCVFCLFTSCFQIFDYFRSLRHGDSAPQSVWDFYYNTKYLGNDYKFVTSARVSAKKYKAFVYSCIFHDLTSGSINFSKNDIKFLHSLCIYDKCLNSDKGGAIYFSCQGSIVQHRFCTRNTYVTQNSGFHSYTFVMTSDISHNIVVESSISNCKQQKFTRTIELRFGNIGIFSSNISKNEASSYSGADFQNAIGVVIVNFSTFEGNKAVNGYMCLSQCRARQDEDYMCNFVGNEQSHTWHGSIHICGVLYFENCTVLGPYGKGAAFSADYTHDKLYIINCNVDKFTTHVGYYSTSGIKNLTILNSLPHLSTYECEAANSLGEDKFFHYRQKIISNDIGQPNVITMYECITMTSD